MFYEKLEMLKQKKQQKRFIYETAQYDSYGALVRSNRRGMTQRFLILLFQAH